MKAGCLDLRMGRILTRKSKEERVSKGLVNADAQRECRASEGMNGKQLCHIFSAF